MADIPGIIFALIGAAVSIASYVLEFEKLKLFFYLGIVLATYGLIKMFIFGMKKRSNNKKMKPINLEREATKKKNYCPKVEESPLQSRYCPNCGARLQGYENFCPTCGTRLR